MTIKKSNRYCQGLLNLNVFRSRALTNLVMALGSYEGAHSVTELSLSPVYHYQYGSISKAISWLAKDSKQYDEVALLVLRFCLNYYESCQRWAVLQTDASPVGKAHSPTLKDRTYVAVPNQVIRGNKPIDVGYHLSCVNLRALDGWSLPLLARRVKIDETASDCAVEQLAGLLNSSDLGLVEQGVINLLDSSYGTASYLSRTHQHENLVNVVRLRANRKVWTAAQADNPKGAPRIYGHKYYLQAQSQWKTYQRHPKTGQPYEVWQESIFDRAADEQLQIPARTKKGRALRVELWRWNDLKMRSKDGYDMKDKTMDVLAGRVYDAQTGQLVFDQELFIGICGQQKDHINTQQAYELYRERYGIESYFRFSKQKLKLDQFQTPDVQHLDNYLLVLQLTAWLLYVMRNETQYVPKKWQKYNPKEKQALQGHPLSMAQCRKAAETLFLTFEPGPFLPLKSKKGKGRQKGQTQTPRTRYNVVKKNNRKTRFKTKTEKLE